MTKYIWICKQSWVYEGKTWWKREEVEHVPCTPVLRLFYLNGRAGIYMYLQPKKHIKHYRWNVCPLFLKKHGKIFQILLQYLCNEPLSALKAIVGKISGKSSLFCNIFSTKNMVNKQTSKSHCNSLDMTHWMFVKEHLEVTVFMGFCRCLGTSPAAVYIFFEQENVSSSTKEDKSWKRFCKRTLGGHSFHGFLQVFGNLPCSCLHFFWAGKCK